MFRKFAAVLLCVTMTVGMTGCQKSGTGETSKPQNENKTENAQGKSEDQSGKTEGDKSAQGNSEDPAGNGADEGNGSGEEVTIPMILTTGTNDAQDIVTGKIVDDFNEAYKGKYHVDVEKLAGSADDYRQKIKMLNSSESLPAVLFGMGTEPAFLELLTENDRLVDMAPYLENDQEWKDTVIPQSIEEFTTDKGMFLVPVSGVQMSGIYYNKELFEKAGIKEFPKDWDSFWKACDSLKAAGIKPVSMHTTETAWCAMLMATAHMAQTDAGMEFLQKQYPDTYDTKEFREGMEVMVRLFKDYTTEDAVGGTYALASNHFFSEDTAMIANGPWMMSSLTDTSYVDEGFVDKIGYAPYPGNVMEAYMGQGAMVVTKDHPQEVIDGAVLFVKFYSRPEYVVQSAVETGSMPVTIEIEQSEIDKMISPMKEYVECAKNVDVIFPNYQNKWDPVVQQEVLGRELPNLIYDSITLDDFIKMLDDGAKQYKSDVE